MSQVVVVDRIEGDVAVLSPVSGGPPFDCPVAWLPGKVSEGAALRLARAPDAGIGRVKAVDEAGVVVALADGSTLGLRPGLLPPGIAEGEALLFVEAPEVEDDRRLRITLSLDRFADQMDDDIDL